MNEDIKTEKIAYYYNTLSLTELHAIYMTISTIFLMIVPTVILACAYRDIYNISYAIVETVSLGLSVPFLLVGYNIRKEKSKWPKLMMANGKKVIGHIVSLEDIEIGKRIGTKGFTYRIEYEDPDSGKAAIFNTPRLLKEKMCVTEKDLPLEVTVYVYKGMAYADEIINPPIHKMNKRRLYYWLPVFIAIVASLIAIPFAYPDAETVLVNMIHMGYSLSALLFIAMFYLLYKSDITNKEL